MAIVNKQTGDPYENLANAVIAQAAEDYRRLLKRVKKNPANREALDEALQVERFFRSGWYQRLTNVDGEFLIRKLQENI
ncbi:MAG: hypothetical protein ACLRT5_21740 [Lachnospiraceae bacterium]